MPVITLNHTGEAYHFHAYDENMHEIKMDTSDDHGGTNYGFRPMQNLLAALAGCSAIDIVSILKKQRIEFSDLEMKVSGEREQNKVPALWQTAHMIVSMRSNGDRDLIEKALKLSIEKYCSVAETLRRAGCVITYELKTIQ